jgi:DNA-binding MarR family transcriptional regulator
VDATELNLPTLAMLAGVETSRSQLARLAAEGYPGVRRSHGYVFQHLVAGEPTIGALAAALGITQQGASKQVRELEELGYVERRAPEDDARARTVRLTTRGQLALGAGREIQAGLEAELVDRLGAEKVAAAKEVLAELLDVSGAAGFVRDRSFPAPTD